MKRKTWMGASISATVLALSITVPMASARQEKPCADASRRKSAITLARQINTAEIHSHQRTKSYQPISALQNIPILEGFTVQLVINASGSQYLFSIKDMQDPCNLSIFSDQEQVIYTAQPLQ